MSLGLTIQKLLIFFLQSLFLLFCWLANLFLWRLNRNTRTFSLNDNFILSSIFFCFCFSSRREVVCGDSFCFRDSICLIG